MWLFEPRRQRRSKLGDGWVYARWSKRQAGVLLVVYAKSFTYAQNRSPVAFGMNHHLRSAFRGLGCLHVYKLNNVIAK